MAGTSYGTPVKSLYCPMRAASLSCPHWRLFLRNEGIFRMKTKVLVAISKVPRTAGPCAQTTRSKEYGSGHAPRNLDVRTSPCRSSWSCACPNRNRLRGINHRNVLSSTRLKSAASSKTPSVTIANVKTLLPGSMCPPNAFSPVDSVICPWILPSIT